MRSRALVSAVMNTSRLVLNVVCTLECSTWTGMPSCRWCSATGGMKSVARSSLPPL